QNVGHCLAQLRAHLACLSSCVLWSKARVSVHLDNQGPGTARSGERRQRLVHHDEWFLFRAEIQSIRHQVVEIGGQDNIARRSSVRISQQRCEQRISVTWQSSRR